MTAEATEREQSIAEMTAELESVSQQMFLLENRRRELIWKRNRALADNALQSEQLHKEDRHVAGVRQS